MNLIVHNWTLLTVQCTARKEITNPLSWKVLFLHGLCLSWTGEIGLSHHICLILEHWNRVCRAIYWWFSLYTQNKPFSPSRRDFIVCIPPPQILKDKQVEILLKNLGVSSALSKLKLASRLLAFFGCFRLDNYSQHGAPKPFLTIIISAA